MDHVARGERLGPELISAAISPDGFAPRLARVFFGTLLFSATYVIAWMTSSSPHQAVICLVIAIITGTLGGFRSNGRHLLWLWSETLGHPRAIGAVLGMVPSNLQTGRKKRVPASALEPGDWISDWEDHQGDLRADGEARERLARSLTRIRDEVSYKGIAGMPVPRYDSMQSLAGLPEPAMRFSQVLAILPAMDGALLELGLVDDDPTRVSPNRPYYRREALTLGLGPQASRSSAAVEKLVGILPRDMSAKPERNLLSRLVGDGYDEPAIWHAIRACRAAGLISVDRRGGWTAEAIRGIFRPGNAPLGHEHCCIKLTKLGRIWADAGDPRRIATPTYWEFVMGDKITGDKVMGDKVMGDKYEFEDAGAVGPNAHAENVQFNPATPVQIGDTQVLAEQLAQVLEVLEARSRGTSQDLATIEAVRSAKAAADASDANQTMAHLARAGKWALEAATLVGATVAATAIQHAIGL